MPEGATGFTTIELKKAFLGTALDAPASVSVSATRHGAARALDADPATLLGHIAARWDGKVFVGDAKALLGLDQGRPGGPLG